MKFDEKGLTFGVGGNSWGNFSTGVRATILNPTPFIYLTFEKKPACSYALFHRKLTYLYTVL